MVTRRVLHMTAPILPVMLPLPLPSLLDLRPRMWQLPHRNVSPPVSFNSNHAESMKQSRTCPICAEFGLMGERARGAVAAPASPSHQYPITPTTFTVARPNRGDFNDGERLGVGQVEFVSRAAG